MDKAGQSVVVACFSVAVLACNSGEEPAQPRYDDAVGTRKVAVCADDLPPFAIGDDGLTVSDPDQQIFVRIDDASALPPVKNFNDWTVAVLDANGQPLTTAKLGWACAWMAVHTHGSNPKQIEDLGDGRFALNGQNLAMAGPWAVKLWVDPTGEGLTYVPQKGSAVREGDVCQPSNGAAPQPNIEFDVCVPEMRGGT